MKELSGAIGNKIKSLRTIKGITQGKLSENLISRNMLSMIENGVCMPSVETLVALSERLNVNPGYLLSFGEEAEAVFHKEEIIRDLKSAYIQGLYENVVQMTDLKYADDEILYIYALSQIHLAEKCFSNFCINSGKKHLKCALIASQNTIYQSDSVQNTVKFFNFLADTVNKNPNITELESISYQSPIDFTLYKNMLLYIKALCLIDLKNYDFVHNILNSGLISESDVIYNSLYGKLYLHNKNYVLAKEFLLKTEIQSQKNFFVLFKTTIDLQKLYELTENFKEAYFYSEKRLRLLEAFEK